MLNPARSSRARVGSCRLPLGSPDDPSCTDLYVSLAHGSRGLITAPLCASLLADLLDGTPALLPHDLVQALRPARFPLGR